MTEREEDLKWIEHAKRSPRAFAPLYEKYHAPVFRFVYSRVRDKALSADLVSQTFTKALYALKNYEDRGYAFSSWLFRIAINEINMHFRKASKHQHIPLEMKNLESLEAEAWEERSDRDPQELIPLLNQLNEDQIILIELRFFDKRSFAEIGEILGIAEDTAKMRVYRVLKKLRQLASDGS